MLKRTIADIDYDTQTLTLRDSKGRRKEPRRRVVPLIPEALHALGALVPAVITDNGTRVSARVGDALFSASLGRQGASYHGCASSVRDVALAMISAGEIDAGKRAFTIGDLRRTVETRLAALGVPVDIRAQLQSHGLGGIQARHYDRHDYADEKRAALEKLRDLLKGSSATVTTIRRARTKV